MENGRVVSPASVPIHLNWLKSTNMVKVKVKVSHSPTAVGAVGVRVPLYLGHN